MSGAPGAAAEGGRHLGFWTATSLVVGNMIGSGIFLLPSALAAYGGISIVGWLFTAAGSLLLAAVFVSLSRARPGLGGPYAFVRGAFGDLAGFIVAYGYWISIICGNAAIAIASVSYLSILFPVITTSSRLDIAASLIVVWSLTAINLLGIRVSGRVQLVATVLKVLPLAVVAALVFFHFDPAHFVPFNAGGGSPFGAVTATAALTLWAFLGLESATIPADSIRDPARTIPRATIAGTTVVALVYILSTVSVMGILPRELLAQSNAPFADAAARLFGPAAGYFIAFAGAASCVGALNGWILLQGQMPLAAARDSLFPRWFAAVSRNGTPAQGIIVSSVIVSVLLLMNYTEGFVEKFTFVILLATLATLVPYLLSALAQMKNLLGARRRARQDGRESGGRAFAPAAAVAALAFLYSAWAVVGLGASTIFWGLACIATGLPIYFWLQLRQPK